MISYLSSTQFHSGTDVAHLCAAEYDGVAGPDIVLGILQVKYQYLDSRCWVRETERATDG